MAYTITAVNSDVKIEKNAWRSVLLSVIASLPFFTHALETTELYASTHSSHFVSSQELVPWNATALILAAAVSAPVYCYLIDKFGRKTGLFIISLTQGASCIPLFLPPDEVRNICLHVVAGLSTGGLFTVIPSYICEVSSLGTRGFNTALMMLFTTFGYVLKLVMDLEVMMYLMAAMVVIQLLSMICLLESPSYLVMIGEDEKAKQILAKLYGNEMDNANTAKDLEDLKDESYRAKSHGKLSLINIFKNLIWRDATKIAILIQTTMVLCGSILFLDQDKALMQLRISSDPDKLLIVVGIFVGSLVAVALIKFTERKYILSCGYIIMVLSMGILAVYTQSDLTVTSLRWLPVAALSVLVFGYGMAWGLPTIIFVEIFNFEIRATMIGMLFTYSQIIKLIHIHTYKYIEDYIGVYTLLYMFAAINLYGGVYGLFALPDIKNKNVKQIEKQLKRIPLIKL